MAHGPEPQYAILEEITGLPRKKLGDGNSPVIDLGIAGADGWELIDKLDQVYKIDWKDFDPYDHFDPEFGFNPLIYFWRRGTGEQKAYEAIVRKVTVGHIKGACLAGHWLDP